MTPQIYLIAPGDAEEAAIASMVDRGIGLAGVAALLLPRGQRDGEAYASLVRAVAPGVQAREIAVLIEGEPPAVRALGADGLHVAGPLSAARSAVAALKPDFIVGVGGIRSRHDAMQKGELEIDYILFGPLSGPTSAADRELAQWWAETMEIPSVFSDPEATSPAVDAAGSDFVGLNLAALEAVR